MRKQIFSAAVGIAAGLALSLSAAAQDRNVDQSSLFQSLTSNLLSWLGAIESEVTEATCAVIGGCAAETNHPHGLVAPDAQGQSEPGPSAEMAPIIFPTG